MSRRTTKMTSARRSRSKKKEKTEDEEMLEKEPKGSFAWKLFLPSQIKTLITCDSPEDLEEKMGIALNFDQYEVDLREGAQVDYFVTAFHWAKEKAFDDRQLGGFMALLSSILDNLKENNMPKTENIKFLKDSFLGVGLDNPEQIPISLYFFTLEQAKDVMEYLLTTFFQHYDLYDFLFKNEQDELIIGSDLTAEVCPEDVGPLPPPLEEAMLFETFEKFVLEKTPETEEEVAEKADAAITDELTDAVLKAVEASPDDAVKNVSPEELRKVIEKVTNELILPTKKELREKIKEKETTYLAKIGKVQPK
ncbi:ciliary-associated calcium-binding coiled-coil protein 1-like isoform X2 [Styela clava]|uniref:ciliary-associated calcium-binding coiled-coil protein 1-like isoform X1 n=2 Tax=Styela clava TaxID=7725 RepID=UPI00193978F7|nr:ciliary-associated calcium-binding coiled-coil protein 1-like isoform X1 [Styela clava]